MPERNVWPGETTARVVSQGEMKLALHVAFHPKELSTFN